MSAYPHVFATTFSKVCISGSDTDSSGNHCGVYLDIFPSCTIVHMYSIFSGSNLGLEPPRSAENTHCLKWLKFHFCEPENSRLFAEFLVPIGWIIFLGL